MVKYKPSAQVNWAASDHIALLIGVRRHKDMEQLDGVLHDITLMGHLLTSKSLVSLFLVMDIWRIANPFAGRRKGLHWDAKSVMVMTDGMGINEDSPQWPLEKRVVSSSFMLY
jgi:hypothetical protein